MELPKGLSGAEVAERVARGQVNTQPPRATKTVAAIVRDNILTLFNAVNVIIAVAVFFTGSYRNMLFMGIVLCNVLIGIVQEIRSKRAVDELTIISEPRVNVVRDGELREIAVAEVVTGDVMELALGRQVCADAVVVSGGAELNESLLTGEPDAIYKREGDELLSGSFVVSGRCFARAEHVGAENFATKLTIEASLRKKLKSELMTALNRIIRFTSVLIFPVGALLFCKQYFILSADLRSAVVQTAAAMIGMIPEGLILLTSVALAVGVVKLSRRRVLVRELYCIETLARVDTLCLDKTGTLTEGAMSVEQIVSADADCERELARAVAALPADNATMRALAERFPAAIREEAELCPFSSARKWSGANFKTGCVIIGAPERVLSAGDAALLEQAGEFEKRGCRVVAIAAADCHIENMTLPAERRTLGLAVLTDRIRESAHDTLRYFAEQGVTIKIISGDSAATVSAVAQRAGVADGANAVDMSAVGEDADFTALCERYTVFARVSPTQKRSLVNALKSRGHTVAMTGDGVNDVLSLKEADCSIAMGAGSDAARQVAYMVLLDSDFSALPGVVAEGRRVINNIERTASMFLVKTIYSLLLSLMFIAVAAEYPFQPIQLTLISALTVGVPSFFLALEPSLERVTGSFLKKVLGNAIPGALVIVAGIIAIISLKGVLALSDADVSSLCVYATGATGFAVLLRVCMPFSPLRGAMCALLMAAFVGAAIVLHELLCLTWSMEMLWVIVPVCALGLPLIAGISHGVRRVMRGRK